MSPAEPPGSGDPIELVALGRELVGARPKPVFGKVPRGGILNPAGLVKVLADAIPFERIDGHIRSGKLLAASVLTTHVSSGRTVVFVQHHDDLTPRWGSHLRAIRLASSGGAERGVRSPSRRCRIAGDQKPRARCKPPRR